MKCEQKQQLQNDDKECNSIMATKSNWLLRGHDAPEIKKYPIKRFIVIENDMFCSSAFKSLSAQGMWVLLRFLQKREWNRKGKKGKWEGYRDLPLAFTYAEAEAFGISTSQFHSIIKRLVEVGFIDVDHQGGFYGKDYSRFRLSARWRDYGTPEFRVRKKERVLQPGLDVQSHKAKIAMKSDSSILTKTNSIAGSMKYGGCLNLVAGKDVNLQRETDDIAKKMEDMENMSCFSYMVMKNNSPYISPFPGVAPMEADFTSHESESACSDCTKCGARATKRMRQGGAGEQCLHATCLHHWDKSARAKLSRTLIRKNRDKRVHNRIAVAA